MEGETGMTTIKLILSGAKARAEVNGVLTSGMVGIPVTIVCDDAWKGLVKNLVCRSGRRYDPPDEGTARIIANVGGTAAVAQEVMEAGRYLYLGVEGYSADGTRVMPTTWAECGMIHPGAHANDPESADPTLPVWAQLEAEVAKLKYEAVTEEQITRVVEDYLQENPIQVPDAPPNGGSAVCYTAQELTDGQKAQARENIGAASDAPAIVGTAVGERAMAFSNLMHGMDAVESFLFFADPHFLNSIDNESQMRAYLETLKLYFDTTPTSFVVSGGDWYGNSDTYESACFKLGYIDGWMRRLFGQDHYPALGNHDTNQQGKDETGGTWTGLLPRETVRNLWYRAQGSNYYAFAGANTGFYVLDTWKEGGDTDYYWEQIGWLAEKLKEDDPANAALVLHMGYYPLSTGGYAVDTLAANALKLSEAFNNAGSITLNGTAYNFAGCTGKVRFALSGHIHADHATIVNGIPLIATTDMRAGNTPTFDLCLADYGANKLHLVRVGTGADRSFTMGPNGSVLEETEDTPVDETPVLLLGMNLTGPTLYNNVTFRSVYVGKAQPEGITTAIPWSNASTGEYPYSEPYYPIGIPDGAKRVIVTCPAYVKWAVVAWTKDTWNAKSEATVDSGWLPAGGGTYELAAELDVLMILFNDNNGSDMSAESYDSSAFSLAFDNAEDAELPVTLTVADPVVFLAQCNHNGAGINYYDRPTRAITATTENTGVPYEAATGTPGATHYALKIPSGARTVMVNCGDGLQWAFDAVDATGHKIDGSAGWMANGATDTIPAAAVGYYTIKFCLSDGSSFAADHDPSGISWTFA